MGCRVGTSKTPRERIEYWKRREGHTEGRVLATNLTFAEAQDREESEAKARYCYFQHGGAPGADRYRRVWSVYLVSGGVTPRR